jgi:2-polyprenyl-6-methoxyphenol hydroxylase-like FAD-dependent oxidoreductase
MQIHSQDSEIDVLIVGAGPAGLMMACQLALHKISFRIIDKKEHRTNYSGALIVQARSLEIFQQMGIAQKVVRGGVIAKEIKLIFNGKKSFAIPVKEIGIGISQFPWMLLLEQSVTEQFLIDYIRKLGYYVEWETELVQFKQDSQSVTSVLKLPDGHDKIITSKYLIAADGARSTTRKQLQIPFPGKSHPISLFVCDCRAEGDLSSDQLCFSFSDRTTSGFFPLPGGRWRVDGAISKDMMAKDQPTFEDIKINYAHKTRINVELCDPDWYSVFHVNERCAVSFQQNRCFLVGDAAHIHSPVGAQGMNTGLQDSYNLAWKLSYVIKGLAKTSLLDTYSCERVVVAKNVVRGTDLAFRIVTSQNFFIKLFRVHILPHVLGLLLPLFVKHQFMPHFLFRMISQISVHYRKSALSLHSSFGNFPVWSPKPGERLPYICYQENEKLINIQQKVTGTDFHLFIFSKHLMPNGIRKITEKYAQILSCETIANTFETADLYKQLGIDGEGFYFIRPDLYIAYRSCEAQTDHFEEYLRQFINVNIPSSDHKEF